MLDEPLAVVVQAASAGGKSSLMEAVLALIPEEDRVQYSAMTGQSLFYLGEADLRHKVLAIVEQERAERASYALKLLQSEGALTIASTGKDAATGRLITQAYRVEGPVALMLTTTAVEVDEELLNRSIVLTVDEGREQTRAIHDRQRAAQTLEGVLARHERQHLLKLHRDAQRLLRPVLVVNPFAKELSFLDHATRTRRDHMKYLTLIRTIALLHQHQRSVKTAEHRGQHIEYVEVTREDIAVANRLCHEVLGRSLDELNAARPQLVLPPDPGTLFLTQEGEEISCHRLTQLVREYVIAADMGKSGACHLFRHTCATLMLEGGADIRYIQEMLGHVELSTTQIYTQVSIRKLKAVHTLTHPGAKLERAAGAASAAAEATTTNGEVGTNGTVPAVDAGADDGNDQDAVVNAPIAPVSPDVAAEALFAALDAEAEEEATGRSGRGLPERQRVNLGRSDRAQAQPHVACGKRTPCASSCCCSSSLSV